MGIVKGLSAKPLNSPKGERFWIPAFAGMTGVYMRKGESLWIPASAGMMQVMFRTCIKAFRPLLKEVQSSP